ncbi:MAG: dTDP-4-dehydrorhamnose 3,5-epimerase family protein [Candidatus Bathyarchaeia archaeon]
MIQGVEVKHLKVISDERGWLYEILRQDEAIFEQFGQVYITTSYSGIVKAWHMHKLQTDYLCVVRGMAKIALYDGRKGSPTRGEVNEFFAGERNPILIKVPARVWHGFKAIGHETAYVLNIPTLPYNHEKPDEYRLPYDTDKIPYRWETKMG